MSETPGRPGHEPANPTAPASEIAGFPAERVDVVIEAVAPGDDDRRLPLYRVGELERWIDRKRLLRDPDAPEPPYWAMIWIGARAIAARLLEVPPAAGDRVLDLGCGLGLSGVAAGVAGTHVVFADKIEAAVAFARANAALNGLASFEARTLDFTRERLDLPFDVILAADIVYNPDDYEPLVDFIDAHLVAGGRLLLTESLRADARQCVRSLVARGYLNRTETSWILEEGKRERTWLHTMTKPRG